MLVEVYSDVACPWCYIGERRFARALAERSGRDDIEIVFRPYQLDPAASRTPIPLVESLRRKFGPSAGPMMQRVSEAAAAEGIVIHWDEAIAVNTLTAHRLARLALRESGAAMQRALVERLFAAHFTHGVDIANPVRLAELAAAAGMDRVRVGRYLASDEGLAEVQAEMADARALGVRAVPTFVLDARYVLEGAQAPAVFRRALEEVAAASARPGGAGHAA